LRFLESCPWQAKQFFARIGRISRLNSTGTAHALPAAKHKTIVGRKLLMP
jgi:hypothetical protein